MSNRSNNQNFAINRYDLGTDTSIGLDKADIDNALVYSANEIPTQCYACTAPNPVYQVIAKDTRHNTAQIQNGLYICKHCLDSKVLDQSLYGVRSLI